MRLALLLPAAAAIAGLAGLAAPALAADKPAVDLVAAFALGIVDGATMGIVGDTTTSSTAVQTGPGAFNGTPNQGKPFSFAVVESGKCLYDIRYSEDGTFVGGIQIDAGKLTSVAYGKTAEHAPLFDYTINLVGKDGVVQLLGPDGQLAPTESNSTLSTSLTEAEMQAAVTAFQSAYCPAAA